MDNPVWDGSAWRDGNDLIDLSKSYDSTDNAAQLFIDLFGDPLGFDDLAKDNDREWLVKVNVNGVEYDNKTVVDFKIERSLTLGDEFELGTATLSMLVIKLRTNNTIPSNAKFTVSVALAKNGAQSTDWYQMGEWYVDNRSETNGVWTFECLDCLVFADIPYISQLTYPTTMRNVWDEVCSRAGLSYDSSVVIDPSYQIMAGPAGFSCRQMMGYIASANSASVFVGEDGKVRFRRFHANDQATRIFTKKDYIRVTQTNPVKTYTRVVVIYDTEDGLYYEAGSGDENHTLYVENPFATQKITDDLYAKLYMFSYMPIKMDARGFPKVLHGERIRFGEYVGTPAWQDADTAWNATEYTWDGFLPGGGISLALHTVFTFRGGLRMSIEAPSISEQASEFAIEGTLEGQINRLNRNTVRYGKPYYGITHSPEHGMISQRSDGYSKLTINSDVLLDWEIGGQRKLYYDDSVDSLVYDGNIIMRGGFISWTDVNPPTPYDVGALPLDSPRLSNLSDIGDYIGQLSQGQVEGLSNRMTNITPTGVYTGTVGTDQLIAGSALIGNALIGSIEANKITVTDGKITAAQIENLRANQIDVTTGKITTAQIEDLTVGGNVTMGPNATISWDQVTDQPSIPTLPGYIKSTYIDSTQILSPSISSGIMTGGVVQTAPPGTYPRVELNTTSQMFKIEKNANTQLWIQNEVAGDLGMWLQRGGANGVYSAYSIVEGKNSIGFGTMLGNLEIFSWLDNIDIYASNGKVRFDNWGNILSKQSNTTLAYELGMRPFAGINANVYVVRGFSGEIPLYGLLTFSAGVLINVQNV